MKLVLCRAFAFVFASSMGLALMGAAAFGQTDQDFDPFGAPPENLGAESKATESTQGSDSKAFSPLQDSSQDFATQGSSTQGSTTQGSSTQGSMTQGSSTGAAGSATNQGSAAKSEQPTGPPFEEKFWKYLSANNYKNWAPVPGQSAGFTAGQSPHGDLVKMYLNRTAAGAQGEMPIGSVIIKENYNNDETLMAITVMYKSKGFNPLAGDWYWAKYNPDGSIAMTGEERTIKKIAGRFKSCIECHRGAGGDDYLFYND